MWVNHPYSLGQQEVRPNHIAYQDGKYYLLESEDDVTYDDGDEFHEIKHTLVSIEEAFEK